MIAECLIRLSVGVQGDIEVLLSLGALLFKSFEALSDLANLVGEVLSCFACSLNLLNGFGCLTPQAIPAALGVSWARRISLALWMESSICEATPGRPWARYAAASFCSLPMSTPLAHSRSIWS